MRESNHRDRIYYAGQQGECDCHFAGDPDTHHLASWQGVEKGLSMTFAPTSASTPCVKVGFSPLVLSRIGGGETTEGEAGCEDFFNILLGEMQRGNHQIDCF